MIAGRSLLLPRRGKGGMGVRTGRGEARAVLAVLPKPEGMPGSQRPTVR
jgi:hypothetical protein